MSSSTDFPITTNMSNTMHTNCTTVVLVQARDGGRKYKKLCVESERRQGGGAHTVEQGSSWHRLAPQQGAAQAWDVGVDNRTQLQEGGVEEGLLTEW